MLEMVLFGFCGLVLGMSIGSVNRHRNKTDFVLDLFLAFVAVFLFLVLLFYSPVVRYTVSVFYGFFVGFFYEAVESAVRY